MCSSPSHSCSRPAEIRQVMSEVFQVQDMEKMDLFHCLKTVPHLLSHLIGEYRKDGKLSQARMRLLIRLVIENRMGNDTGLLPSELSEFLGVSRNTVSALLNGLQEQGLIERHLHPTDHRQFLIRITPAGYELIGTRAPQYAAFVVSLLENLSPEECQTLLTLLNKLHTGLLSRAAEFGIRMPGIDSDALTEQA
jgi:DNA-binding MarR family transcriptional regulator